MSEVCKVIGAEKPVNLDIDQDSEGEDEAIFDQQVIPESVRIIQKLERYTKPDKIESVQNLTRAEVKLDDKIDKLKYCEMSDTEAMTDMSELDCYVNSYGKLAVDEGRNPLKGDKRLNYDAALLDCNLPKLIETPISEIKSEPKGNDIAHLGNQNAFANENCIDDPLEALYFKMNMRNQTKSGVMPRSDSRDSSLSEESMDGNIDDSGVECDGATCKRTPVLALGEMRNEIYRAEGRPRPVDHRHSGSHWRKTEGELGTMAEQPCREFSLEKYISKSM